MTLLLLAACSTITAQPQAVPPQAATTMCGKASPLAKSDREKFCGALAAMHEAKWPEDASGFDGPVYRAWLMTPDQPIVLVRVETRGKDTALLTVRRLTRGTLSLDRTAALSEDETVAFLKIVAATHVATLPLASDAPTLVACKTPSILAAESYALSSYNLALSHCAAMKPLADFATGLYDLASTHAPELKQGLEPVLD